MLLKLFRLSVITLCICGTTVSKAETKNDDIPQVFTMSPHGVNLQTGGFVYSQTDLNMGPLTFERSWKSIPSFSRDDTIDHHAFGRWNHNFSDGISYEEINRQSYTAVYAGGVKHLFIFVRNPDRYVADTLHSSAAIGSTLTRTTTEFRFVDKAGAVYTFFHHSALVHNRFAVREITYPDGMQLTFTYNSAGFTKTVSSNKGYALVVDYGSNGKLSAVCGYNLAQQIVTSSTSCQFAPVKVTYSYSASQFGDVLTGVTGSEGGLTGYTYNDDYFQSLTCIRDPGAAVCRIENTYGPEPGVAIPNFSPTDVLRQKLPDGTYWQYSYARSSPDDPPQQPGEIRRTSSSMIDPDGNETNIVYANGLTEELTTAAGSTKYLWAGVQLRAVIFPEGNQVLIEREFYNVLDPVEVRKVAKAGSSLPDEVIHWDYPIRNFEESHCAAASPKQCGKPTKMTDQRGHVTNYEYAAEHGGLLKETGPAVNGVRPQTRHEYGQRYAWLAVPDGGYQRASAPIWLLFRTRVCRTTAATADGGCVGGAADETVTSYDYGPDSGPNNLLVRGVVVQADGRTLRTCFGYDNRGRKISETAPQAGLGQCL